MGDRAADVTSRPATRNNGRHTPDALHRRGILPSRRDRMHAPGKSVLHHPRRDLLPRVHDRGVPKLDALFRGPLSPVGAQYSVRSDALGAVQAREDRHVAVQGERDAHGAHVFRRPHRVRYMYAVFNSISFFPEKFYF